MLTDGCTKLKDVVMELEVRKLQLLRSAPTSRKDEDEPKGVEPEPVNKKAHGQNGKPATKGKPAANGKTPVKTRTGATGGRVVPSRTRGGQREQIEQTTAEKIKANQARLHAQRNADGLNKWANGGGGDKAGQDKAVKRFESYRREEQLPRAVEERRVSQTRRIEVKADDYNRYMWMNNGKRSSCQSAVTLCPSISQQ